MLSALPASPAQQSCRIPTRTVARGEAVSVLPVSDQLLTDFSYAVDGQTYDLYDVLAMNRVSGMVIIRNGEILFEKYLLGNTEDTRWMSMSVVKSMTSTLIGAAIQDGYIDSIDDPIVNYLPRFNGTAYDGVTVRHLLQMSSGVAWNETYTDPTSDRRRMLEAQISGQAGGRVPVGKNLDEDGDGSRRQLVAAIPRGDIWSVCFCGS